MAIEVICSCGGKQRVPNSYERMEIKCASCGNMVLVLPEGERPAAKAAAPKLVERRLEFNNYTLIGKFRPEQPGIDSLLKTVAARIGMGSSSLNGTKITVGWSVLSIRQKVEELYLEEPDFAIDPHKFAQEDLTTSLKVNELLSGFTKLLPGLRLFDCTCFDTITCPTTVFQNRTLFLRRLRHPSHSDSGLYLSPNDPMEFSKTMEQQKHKVQVGTETERMETYVLLKNRMSILRCLGLPLDHMAQFEGDELTHVYGPKNKLVWSKK